MAVFVTISVELDCFIVNLYTSRASIGVSSPISDECCNKPIDAIISITRRIFSSIVRVFLLYNRLPPPPQHHISIPPASCVPSSQQKNSARNALTVPMFLCQHTEYNCTIFVQNFVQIHLGCPHQEIGSVFSNIWIRR